MKRVLAALPVTCAVLLAAGPASAAVQVACVPPAMIPDATSFPANLPGFAYQDTNPPQQSISLREGTGTPKDVTTSVVDGLLKITPTTPYEAGKQYELDWQPNCNGFSGVQVPRRTFTVTAEAPIPTQIGTLQGDVTATSQDFGTSKMNIVARLAIADEFLPWIGVYQLGLEVDGRVVETHKTVAATNVFQINGTGWCDATNAATTNHVVKLRAKLPFAPPLETAPASVAFTCTAGVFGNPGASTPVPPNGVTPTSPTGTSSTTSSSSSSGGGCTLSPSRASSTLSLLGIGLGLVALVRRGMRKGS